jgi:hypothetical protein
LCRELLNDASIPEEEREILRRYVNCFATLAAITEILLFEKNSQNSQIKLHELLNDMKRIRFYGKNGPKCIE